MGKLPSNFKYVLITPARDEAAFIRKTLETIVSQTVLPLKWVIVSDGSTDGTDEIVKEFSAKHPWIELLRMPDHVPQPPTQLGPSWQSLRLIHQDGECIGNRTVFDDEFAVHVDLAKRQLGVK